MENQNSDLTHAAIIEEWKKLKGTNLDVELEVMNCLSAWKVAKDPVTISKIHTLMLQHVNYLATFHYMRIRKGEVNV